jgi:hypothetical protein
MAGRDARDEHRSFAVAGGGLEVEHGAQLRRRREQAVLVTVAFVAGESAIERSSLASGYLRVTHRLVS